MEVGKILERSKEVFRNCSLQNGAIIAADVSNPIYPKNVKWYGYVWLRDASFVCYACDLLKMYEISERFFKWCLDYAEGLKDGVFAHKYFPNGRIAGDFDLDLEEKDLKREKRKILKNYVRVKAFYVQFQPDQLGTLIWAIYEHSKFRSVEEFRELVEILANGICKYWKRSCFTIPSFDLWEERVALPNLKQVHTYSLAACIKGLECALEICEGNEKRRIWKNTLKQMKRVLKNCYVENIGFVRTYGRKMDETADSSLVSLVWPWKQFKANDERITKTVERILMENKLDGGILRYKGDSYNGSIEFLDLKNNKGGIWPILNYLFSIYFSLKGEKERAIEYFNWVNERAKDGYLAEQIIDNKPASIIPLAWSHAMFVIANKFIGKYQNNKPLNSSVK